MRGIKKAVSGLILVCSLAAPAQVVPAETAQKIEAALVYLVGGHRWHPILKDDQWRKNWTEAIHIASEEYEIPPLLLTAMGFLEGSFQRRVFSGERVGKARGEVGIWQLHGEALRRARARFDLDTHVGQARAGAYWLRECIDHCGGDLEAGLAVYACGRCRTPKGSRAERAVSERLRLWKKLKGALDDQRVALIR